MCSSCSVLSLATRAAYLVELKLIGQACQAWAAAGDPGLELVQGIVVYQTEPDGSPSAKTANRRRPDHDDVGVLTRAEAQSGPDGDV